MSYHSRNSSIFSGPSVVAYFSAAFALMTIDDFLATIGVGFKAASCIIVTGCGVRTICRTRENLCGRSAVLGPLPARLPYAFVMRDGLETTVSILTRSVLNFSARALS